MASKPHNQSRRNFFYYLGCSGCSGIILLASLLLFVFDVIRDDLGSTLSILGAVGMTLGILGVILGAIVSIMAWSQSRELDALLNGEGLLANWTYTHNTDREAEEGYVYVGEKGVYTKRMYFPFNAHNRRLVKIDYKNDVLTFIGWRRSRSQGMYHIDYPSRRVPVPAEHADKARMLVEALSPNEEPEEI